MTEAAVEQLASECPSCGRRFIPRQRFCGHCGLVETSPAAPRRHGIVLSFSRLHRAGAAAVVEAPFTVVLVREEGDGATFTAPLDGNAESIRIGDRVRLDARAWQVENGQDFRAIVVSAAEGGAGAGAASGRVDGG